MCWNVDDEWNVMSQSRDSGAVIRGSSSSSSSSSSSAIHSTLDDDQTASSTIDCILTGNM
jgi:hypothetical protein